MAPLTKIVHICNKLRWILETNGNVSVKTFKLHNYYKLSNHLNLKFTGKPFLNDVEKGVKMHIGNSLSQKTQPRHSPKK